MHQRPHDVSDAIRWEYAVAIDRNDGGRLHACRVEVALLDGRSVQRPVTRDVRVLKLGGDTAGDLNVVVRELSDASYAATVSAAVIGILHAIH